MIILLNGAFGIGKTTVARALVARLPRSMLFDPEIIGVALQRTLRLLGQRPGDFQELPLWRTLTVIGLRVARMGAENIVVPMAFSNIEYLNEIRAGVGDFESHVTHYCLVAPVDVVHARLSRRGSDRVTHAWEYARAAECCTAHRDDAFREHISAVDRTPEQITEDILRRALALRHGADTTGID